MEELGLKSRIRIKKYKSYTGEHGKIAPNMLDRQFKASRMYEKWVTDITEFKVAGEKLYLSPILDLYNREIISYELSESPNFNQVYRMLNKAFNKLPSQTDLVLHSDQGWQYQMAQYQKILEKKNIKQSMSRRGNCLDNAVVENFFGTLKSELYYLKKYKSVKELRKDIEGYIQYYNKERISLALNGMSPIQYRAHYQ
jgi:putative transposase